MPNFLVVIMNRYVNHDSNRTNKNSEEAIKTELDDTKEKLRAMREHSSCLDKELNVVRTSLTEAEASLASHQVDLGDHKERIDRLEEELFAARSELDNARLGLQETTAVKKELDTLKKSNSILIFFINVYNKMLEHERCSGRAKWEEVCNKVLEHESNSPQSRKNSLEVINKVNLIVFVSHLLIDIFVVLNLVKLLVIEVQHLEYMAAFEEKITYLEKTLQEARNKNEQDKAEKRKLKLALKQLKDKIREKDRLIEDDSLEQRNVAIDEAALVSASPSASKRHDLDVDVEKLKNTIKTLELENRLSRELNTEYNHTMLEMQKEVIALKSQITSLREESKHFEMELKLHEVLEEELERELSQARLKNEDISNAMNTYEEILENLSEQVNSGASENDMRVKELTIEVIDLREQNRLLTEKLMNSTDCIVANECTSATDRQLSQPIEGWHINEDSFPISFSSFV
ncbi:hypothetical protein DICVIV_06333 [Dictyocaulus viviparus]|uniref:Uncharacterized protein n=1 Tax=Dictyocaulus viviparus TaxID=29172 RepID=A0A0D8XYZ8_DICVI|nr:hypothetical protein DICVIV_06333 [Dictyocaulus viviparus]